MLLLLVVGVLPVVISNDGRFNRAHSFVSPFENEHVPFWHYGGSAMTNETGLVLTQKGHNYNAGALWNTIPTTMTEWEVEFDFKIQGEDTVGGEGFAFWFVEKPDIIGTVFGSSDYWNGLGIFFDTFNNAGSGPSPLITAVMNDGTQKYQVSSDGAGQSIGSCSLHIRNLADFSSVKVAYRLESLSVSVALAAEDGFHETFQECFHVDGVVLGLDKYFGFSAHTGGGHIADTHTISQAHVYDFTPLGVSNKDMDNIRRKYDNTKLKKSPAAATDSSSPSSSTPTEMTEADRYHQSVMTTLNQLQDEINMIEHEGVSKGDFSQSQKQIIQISQQLASVLENLNHFKDVQTEQHQLLIQQQTSFKNLKTEMQETRAHTDAPKLIQSFHKEMEIANKKFTELSSSHTQLQSTLKSLLNRNLVQGSPQVASSSSSGSLTTLACGFALGLLGAGVGVYVASSMSSKKDPYKQF